MQQQGPNPQWTAAQLWRYSIIQRVITGKFAWRLGRAVGANREIVQIWPLMAQHINPVPNLNPQVASYFSEYWYFPLGHQSHEKFKLDEVFYAWKPSQSDVRQPETVLEAAQLDIQTLLMLNQYDASWLENGGVPPYIVTSPTWATPEERNAFRAQFSAKFSGPRNAGRALFAERTVEGDFGGTPTSLDSIEIKQIGVTQKDAQLALLRDAKIKAILDAMGVPMSLIGDSSDRTFSNAAQENRNFMQSVIRPLICELQDDVNNRLAPMLGNELGYFDTSGVPALHPLPVFQDDNAALALMNAGKITRAEWRADRHLPAENPDLPPESGEVPASVAAPTAAEVPPPSDTVPPASAPAARAIRNKTIAQIRAKLSDAAQLHTVWRTSEGACDACAFMEGAIDTGKVPIEDTHPNCKCDLEVWVGDVSKVDTVNPGGRSLRDAGRLRRAARLAPPQSSDVLQDVFQAAVNNLIDDQKAAAQARLSGRRGRRQAVLASQSPDALYDKASWRQRTEVVLGPVLAAMGRTSLEIAEYAEQFTSDIYDKLTVVFGTGAEESRILEVFDSFKEAVRV